MKTVQEVFSNFNPKQHIPAHVLSAKLLFGGQLCPS